MGTEQDGRRREARELVGELVRVHSNLRRGDYVISQRGRVVAYAPALVLGDAEFKVSAAGRARVLKLGQRAVHAWIFGRLLSVGDEATIPPVSGERVTYNPFRSGSFERAETGEPVSSAELVLCAGRYAYLIGRPC